MTLPASPLEALPDGPDRAWGWVAHLRAGGTTPWLEWLARPDAALAAGADARRGRYLPGAQQLELLRRLNRTGRPAPELAERVLTASLAGRGRPDRDLAGALPPSRFGLPPVDPSQLPAHELLRVATGLLAEDVAAAGVEPVEQGLLRPWRRRHRLVGDLWLTAPARDHLLRKGRPPGGRGHIAVVVARDLAGVLADTWTARSFSDGVEPWEDWLDGAAREGRVPPRADVLRIARWWAERIGRERVHVVTDLALLPRLVGVRRRLPVPPTVSAEATDLARRTVPVLGLLATPDRRAELLRRGLAPRLAAYPGAPLATPERHREWIADAARRQRDGLLADGYAVHGDVDALLGREAGAGTVPTTDGVLGLALRVLLDGRRQA